MSTILKALKKVEGKRETVAARTEIPRSLKSQVTEESRGWPKRIVVIVIFIVLAIGVAVSSRFWQSGVETEVAQKPAKENKTPEITAKKNTVASRVEKQKFVPVESTLKAPSEVGDLSPKEPGTFGNDTSPNRWTETTIPPPPVVVAAPSEKPVVHQKNRLSEIKQTPKNLMKKQQKGATPKLQTKSKSSVQSKLPTPNTSVIKNAPKVDVPLLEDRSLEIQALVYSEDAAKRMIVLNGEILRQGSDYKGYTIETIESQRILVKKDGKVSALLFGK